MEFDADAIYTGFDDWSYDYVHRLDGINVDDPGYAEKVLHLAREAVGIHKDKIYSNIDDHATIERQMLDLGFEALTPRKDAKPCSPKSIQLRTCHMVVVRERYDKHWITPFKAGYPEIEDPQWMDMSLQVVCDLLLPVFKEVKDPSLFQILHDKEWLVTYRHETWD
jgi:hypothetical protein